jgi:hypothetical protein
VIDKEILEVIAAGSASPFEAMVNGQGEIMLVFEADMPASSPVHRLAFENRHRNAIAAYLANALQPRDRDIRVTSQIRSQDKSFYRLEVAISRRPRKREKQPRPFINFVVAGSADAWWQTTSNPSRMAEGVPAGATTPCHEVTTRSGQPCSIAVGTSGSVGAGPPLR